MRIPNQLKDVFISLLMVVFSSTCCATGAPFGLHWGMTPSQVKELGATIYPWQEEAGLKLCIANELPKGLSIVNGSYLLLFDPGLGLQKVRMLAPELRSDPSGERGKELFSKLKAGLTEKYGEPFIAYERLDKKLAEQRGFYECLNTEGCGSWFAIFTPEPLSITLELSGTAKGNGSIELSYEGPKYPQALEDADDRENETLKDAL